MKIQVIAVAYERVIPLRILIDCFLVQTDPRWNLSIIYDGLAPVEIQEVIGLTEDPRIHFYCTERRYGNFGHPNRRQMLSKLAAEKDDYILMTNDDNYYVPKYVELMLNACSRSIGIVSCNTVHSHFGYDVHYSRLFEGGIDMGAFIVKFPIAKMVGFNHDHFSADGLYAQECATMARTEGLDIIHITKPLFVHN
jgi:hypothetical protein